MADNTLVGGEWNPTRSKEQELAKTAQDAFFELRPPPALSVTPVAEREPGQCFNLLDVSPLVTSGMRAFLEDEFTRCFTSLPDHPWNWNWYLLPAWTLGILFRHGILFPLRLLILLAGSAVIISIFAAVSFFAKDQDRKTSILRSVIRNYARVWISSWSGVVRYHGIRPSTRHRNMVVVCNHTTIFDVCILLPNSDYAVVGQLQPGLLGLLQEKLLGALGCIWFERKDIHDRAYVARKLKEHIMDEKKSPLLVFPEGTCVNNEFVIMFKRGAFDLGAVVYPIAIKYNKIFCDAFWNSKQQSFVRHIWQLMTSWAVVCDVWYLEPQTRREGESSTDFSNRVKAMIAKKAGLVNVDWDGYLKYLEPNAAMKKQSQQLFSEELLKKLNFRAEHASDPLLADASKPPSPQMAPTSTFTRRNIAAAASAASHSEGDADGWLGGRPDAR